MAEAQPNPTGKDNPDKQREDGARNVNRPVERPIDSEEKPNG